MNPVLGILSPAYASVMRMRNWCYNRGVFKTYEIGIPVVSVGNLSVGGTGKTPVVEWITRYYLEQGLRTAIVSRGYKRETKGTVIVSSGEGPIVDAAQGGDEPVQLALRCNGASVVVDENRVRGAQLAKEELGAELIVLDDGFQHRRCGRNLDIVLLPCGEQLEEQRVLPLGRLREAAEGIQRADLLLVTRCSDERAADAAQQRIRKYYSGDTAGMSFSPAALRQLGSEDDQAIDTLHGKRVFGFCGIANPEEFKQTCLETGLEVAEFRTFPDHHRYTHDELRELVKAVVDSKCDVLLTTEKDAVRLADSSKMLDSVQAYYLRMEALPLVHAEILTRALNRLLRA
ncbi:MAG: tetraacyldisaccharide 4'-kinase [Ectothiorhodospiraceae bacterium]|nr:tetraacyldisaccharide 4'-kinase [Ectothiorhodospiraceae bacterium]